MYLEFFTLILLFKYFTLESLFMAIFVPIITGGTAAATLRRRGLAPEMYNVFGYKHSDDIAKILYGVFENVFDEEELKSIGEIGFGDNGILLYNVQDLPEDKKKIESINFLVSLGRAEKYLRSHVWSHRKMGALGVRENGNIFIEKYKNDVLLFVEVKDNYGNLYSDEIMISQHLAGRLKAEENKTEKE